MVRSDLGAAGEIVWKVGCGGADENQFETDGACLGYWGAGLLDPRHFDSLLPVDRMQVEGFKQIVKQDGAGAPMVGQREWSAQRKQENHFLHSGGSDVAVTMWAEFGEDGTVRIRIAFQ